MKQFKCGACGNDNLCDPKYATAEFDENDKLVFGYQCGNPACGQFNEVEIPKKQRTALTRKMLTKSESRDNGKPGTVRRGSNGKRKSGRSGESKKPGNVAF